MVAAPDRDGHGTRRRWRAPGPSRAVRVFSAAFPRARRFAAALKVAGEAAQGAVILAMLPDTAERYLSTVLFEGIAEGGDPEP